MNKNRTSRFTIYSFLIAVVLLVTACSLPTRTSSSQSSQPTVLSVQSSSGVPVDIVLDYAAVAQNVTVETVAAQSASADGPYWEAAPQYRLLTLQGYPVASHLHKPQVYIYPVDELVAANPDAGTVANELDTLLQFRQDTDKLPFLPLFNAAQMMHVQMQYLDFGNGQGVRFLTQFSQGLNAVNNNELIYTFQGLTSDGKYYIAAVLPVTHPVLPTGNEVNEGILNDYPAYMSNMVLQLGQQNGDSFTPDLNQLDAMIRSIQIK